MNCQTAIRAIVLAATGDLAPENAVALTSHLEHCEHVANCSPTASRTTEIPFVVARVVLQDFTGVPLLADLAAMRNVAAAMGKDAGELLDQRTRQIDTKRQ